MSAGYIVETGDEYDTFHLRSDFLPAEHVYLAKQQYTNTGKVGTDDQDIHPVYEVSRLPRCLPADVLVVDTGLLDCLDQFYRYMRCFGGATMNPFPSHQLNDNENHNATCPPDSTQRTSSIFLVPVTPLFGKKYQASVLICIACVYHFLYTTYMTIHSHQHYQFPLVTVLSALLTCVCSICSVISVHMFISSRIVSKLYMSTFLSSIVPTLTTKELQAGWRNFVLLAIAGTSFLGVADIANTFSYVLAVIIRALSTSIPMETFQGLPMVSMLHSPVESTLISFFRDLLLNLGPGSPDFYMLATTLPFPYHYPFQFSIISIVDMVCACIQALCLPLGFLCFAMLIVAATSRTRSTWRMMSFPNCPISPVAPRTVDIDYVLSYLENKHSMLIAVMFTLLTTRFLFDLFAYVTNTYDPVLISYSWYIISKNVLSSQCLFFIIQFPLARLDNNISHLSKVIYRFQAQSKQASSLRKQWVRLALEQPKDESIQEHNSPKMKKKELKGRMQTWTTMLTTNALLGRTGNIQYVDPEVLLAHGISPEAVWTQSLAAAPQQVANSALSLVPERLNRAEEDVQLKQLSDASRTLLSFSFLGWHVSYAGIALFQLGLAGSATHLLKDKARQLQ